MTTEPGEYHPHAACLMYRACHDSAAVRASLAAVAEHALRESCAGAAEAPGWVRVFIGRTRGGLPAIVAPTGPNTGLYRGFVLRRRAPRVIPSLWPDDGRRHHYRLGAQDLRIETLVPVLGGNPCAAPARR